MFLFCCWVFHVVNRAFFSAPVRPYTVVDPDADETTRISFTVHSSWFSCRWDHAHLLQSVRVCRTALIQYNTIRYIQYHTFALRQTRRARKTDRLGERGRATEGYRTETEPGEQCLGRLVQYCSSSDGWHSINLEDVWSRRPFSCTQLWNSSRSPSVPNSCS